MSLVSLKNYVQEFSSTYNIYKEIAEKLGVETKPLLTLYESRNRRYYTIFGGIRTSMRNHIDKNSVLSLVRKYGFMVEEKSSSVMYAYYSGAHTGIVLSLVLAGYGEVLTLDVYVEEADADRV
ncbi:MAG: hypothetical protein GXO26_03785 [Crenarchaeota archaeon]|nr:hypothetical protein [Thermoproteota archaeon]